MSLAGRALEKGLWSLNTANFKDHAKAKRADDTTYGGGSGMLLRPDVVAATLDAHKAQIKDLPLIYLTATGKPLTQQRVRQLAASKGVALVCGHFEGIDERVIQHYKMEQISIGDYVLSGGETAAQVVLDASVRLLEGVISNSALQEESFNEGLLEYPQYTKPRSWNGLKVPSVLLEGNHGLINRWRQQMAHQRTKKLRPDLLQKPQK